LGVEIQRHLGDLGGHRKVAFAVRIGKGLHNLPVPIDMVLLAETAVVGHHRQSRVFGPVEDGLGSGDRVAHPQYLLIAVDCQGQCSSATQRQASALKRSTAQARAVPEKMPKLAPMKRSSSAAGVSSACPARPSAPRMRSSEKVRSAPARSQWAIRYQLSR